MKSIRVVENIEIPQNMHDELSSLPYEEKFSHFTLTKEYCNVYGIPPKYDLEETIVLDSCKTLSLEDYEVLELLVCDGIVVGVCVGENSFQCNDKFFNQTYPEMDVSGFKCGALQ